MGRYKLQKPLPPGESEWLFEADSIRSALQKISSQRQMIMRFTLVIPSGKEKHYKKVRDIFIRITHRDFDDYPMDRTPLSRFPLISS